MNALVEQLLKLKFLAGYRTAVGFLLLGYGAYAYLKGLPLAEEAAALGATITGIGLRFKGED